MTEKRKIGTFSGSDVEEENMQKKLREADAESCPDDAAASEVKMESDASEPNLEDSSNSSDVCKEEEIDGVKKKSSSEEIQEIKTEPEPKKPSPGFVFGSAAKNLVSFAAVTASKNVFESEDSSSPTTVSSVKEESKESASKNSTSEISPSEAVHVETGEEGEFTLVSSKAKLFSMESNTKDWFEKGVGTVKLNLSSSTEDGYSRIIMRSDGVPRVLVNQRIFPELKFELLQSKNLRFSSIMEGSVHHFLLRFRNSEDAINFTAALGEQVEAFSEEAKV